MSCELDWVESRARLFPEDCAVVDAVSGEEWTFKEVHERAERLARYFKHKGIQKGDRVALLAPNHISYFDFLFACMKLGAIFVPMNWRLSEEELHYCLEDAVPRLMGVHEELQGQEIPQELDRFIIQDSHYMDSFPLAKDVGKEEINEEDPLAMIYTGGTTGKPKGAILTYNSIRWNALNTIVSWDLSKSDTTYTCLPMFHTGGLNALSIPILMAGGTVILSPNFEPTKAIQHLIQFRCTIVLFVPTMYHMMIKTDAFQDARFEHMKVFLSGAAPCPLSIYQAFHQKGLQFKEGYGLTEAGPNNFFIHPQDAMQKPGSVGQAMVFNDVRVVLEDGTEAQEGEVGELLLKGSHLFSYYWNDLAATREAFIDGWLHTGDLARRDEEGFFYIVGRKKEMILSGGENVYPLEIEHWLASYEAVNEVAVVGREDVKWGEVVTAFVSLNEGTVVTESQLKEYCEQKLARYKIPKQFHIIEELPKTHVGKIDKKALRAMGDSKRSSQKFSS